jgi:hypothetical protein
VSSSCSMISLLSFRSTGDLSILPPTLVLLIRSTAPNPDF